MKLHVLGIDLGKTVFHLVGLDSTGKVVIRKKCSRRKLLAFTANLQVELIGMESCSGSHFLGRALREQGHEVRLMPAQYVKPYVQTNKSDFLDAEAIAEAVQRPRMRMWSSWLWPISWFAWLGSSCTRTKAIALPFLLWLHKISV
jgi:transposase